MAKEESYLNSEQEIHKQDPTLHSIDSPIKVQLKVTQPVKRRQSLMNPLPASLIIDKNLKNSLKRFSVNQDQIMLQIAKLENFDIKEELDDSRSISGDQSFSRKASPLKASNKTALQVSDMASTSTNQIQQFNRQIYFQLRAQKEVTNLIGAINVREDEEASIAELEQNMQLSEDSNNKY